MRYIHQHQGWPSFTWDEAALAVALGRVRHRQGLLLGRMQSLGFDHRTEADLENLTAEVVKSSAIEGSLFDPASVRSSIARRMGIAGEGDGPSSREVEGAVDVMMDATQKFEEPLTVERLLGWQAALFPGGRNGMRRVLTGQWRTPEMDPMQVVSGAIGRDRFRRRQIHFEAPAAERLPAEVERFIAWFEARSAGIDPVLRAGIAHLWFVTIHPFEDGNGRISRAVADTALAQADRSSQRFYSMSAQIEREKKAYYAALEKTQKGALDVTSWLQWFLDCLDRALARAETDMAHIVQKAATWDWINRTTSLSERQRQVVNSLLDGPDNDISTSRYAKVTGCSPDTAHRDILLLIEAGVMARSREGGRSTRYHLRPTPARV